MKIKEWMKHSSSRRLSWLTIKGLYDMLAKVAYSQRQVLEYIQKRPMPEEDRTIAVCEIAP